MKILKILSGNDGGGVFTCEKQFINYWKSVGITVDAVIIGRGKSASIYKGLVDNFYEFPDMDFNPSGNNLWAIPWKIIASSRYVSQHKRIIEGVGKYDVIIYRRKFFSFLASKISKINSCNVFWHIPIEARNALERLYYKATLKFLKIIPVANSKYTMQSLKGICNYYVYPGFDELRVTNNEPNSDLRKQLNISSDATVFGIAARIKKRKAQHLVINSFKELIKEYHNLHLILAGGPLDSEYARQCLELAKQHKNNIHFINEVDNIATFYSSIDIYVNSRLDAEPFGISVAEAMGSSLPVIALKLGGPSEMVIDGINGWLISNASECEYYKTLKKAVLKKSEWKNMGRNSYEKTLEFRADTNAEKFLSIIKERMK